MGIGTHHSEMETREVSGNDFTDYIAVSLWGSEIILRGFLQRQKWFCSIDFIKVPTFVFSLWIWAREPAATKGSVHPIPFLFTFVSIIFLLQLARQHRDHCSCYKSKLLFV